MTFSTRCPSPVIPGAWPDSSSTKPNGWSITPSDCSAVSDPPLHLERVLSFHQRLALSLPSDFPTSRVPLSPSTTSDNVFFASDSLPGSISSSDDSGLTRFTRHATSNSQSAFADMSISTAYTSASVADQNTPSKLSQQLVNSLTIDQANDHNANIERIHPSSSSIPAPLSSIKSFPDSSRASHYSPHLDNSSSSPTRPRTHVSESPRPSVSPTTTSHTSPASLFSIGESSMTSFPSSPIIFASPSSSQRVFSCSIRSPDLSSEPVHSTASIDVNCAPTLPTLTILSLPETNSASPVPSWTLTPISLTPTVPDYVQGLAGIGQGISSPCILPVPSSSSNRSPYATRGAASGPSSPSGSELLSAEGEIARMRTSAAEYAAAVMSSAWGLDYPAEEQLVEAMENRVVTAQGVDCQNARNSLEGGRGDSDGSVEHLSMGTSTSTRVVDKMKRFGGLVRKFLKGENYKRGNVAQVSVDTGVVHANGLRVSTPIGALPRIRKPRPSLTARTYASSFTDTSNHSLTQGTNTIPAGITPVIRISPPTSPPAPIRHPNRYKPNRFQPLVASQPPQLSKPRPVSLSSLSTFGGTSPFSSNDPESLVRPRARPRARLPVNVEIDGFMPDVPVIKVNRRSTGCPPGLSVPSSDPIRPKGEAIDAPKKKRRFSLSALSTLLNTRELET